MKAPPRFGIYPGTVSHEPVCLEDVMPTLLEMAEIDIPETVQGRSLFPLARGEEVNWRSHLPIEHAPLYQSLTDGKEKYIWFVADGHEQYFRTRTIGNN